MQFFTSLQKICLIAGTALVIVPSALAHTEQGNQSTPPVVQESDESKALIKKVSRLIGYRFYEDMKGQYGQIDVELDFEEVLKGIQQAQSGGEVGMNDEQLQALQTEFQAYVKAKSEAAFKKAVDKNTREGEAFLKQNATAEGVKVLESGLQYKVVKANPDGAIPKATDRVKIHYTGKFIDGEVFDSSVQAGQPAVFAVGGVVSGMSEALQRMHVGEKWEIYIPGKLGYGMRGSQGAIGPNQVLIFELELLEIVNQ